MLMLLFSIGDDRYALDCSQVVEVIPRVILRKVHHAPEYVAGLFNYRGTIVPVIDLCRLMQGTPSQSSLSTRIIMVNYPIQNNRVHLLGLMAERVTDTLSKQEAEFVDRGIQLNEAAYLGDIVKDEKGMIQRIQVEHLLSDRDRAYLLPAGEN